MEYGELVEVYKELEDTAATLEKTSILADFFSEAGEDYLPIIVKLVRGKVFAPWDSRKLGVSTSLAREAIAKATGISEEEIEDWWREEGDLGNAAAKAVDERTQQTLFTDPLDVRRVHETLQEVADYEGEGSQAQQVDAVAGLISDARPDEARYIVRTVVGAMRLGVGEGIIRDALAEAFLDGSEEAVREVERAYEVTNDFAVVAEHVLDGGRDGLRELDVELFRPIKPMLAQKAESMESAMDELGDSDGVVLLETKYDGIRAKLHRSGGEVRMFTRRLEDVTKQFPEVIEGVREYVDADEYIMEAEVVGYNPETGKPVRFQELSKRVKRKYDIEEMAEEIPVTAYLFDLLYLGGESLLDEALRHRLDLLDEVFTPDPQRLERADSIRTESLEEATSFYEGVMEGGHEGVMAKNLDAAYQPGSRVGYQLKVKSAMEPLDLVVTRAKWSEGRKSDFLGRPYLACRDGDELREVGRMHTGFTDKELGEFTELVEPLIQEVDGREAELRPEVVLEVEYEEIQESPKYGSGYALRFPRLKRIRRDLGPEDIDTYERVEKLYEEQD